MKQQRHRSIGNGGQECPPSVEGPFLDPSEEIDIHKNRLPHWQQDDVWVFVTWRLGDSLPKWKVDRWKEEREIWLKNHPLPWDDKTETEYHKRFSGQIDKWLDQGSGSCVLKEPDVSMIVADALRHFDGERYELAAFVVMPNHVHVLFQPLGENTMGVILKTWKGFTARKINRLLGKTGQLWQADYWDRLIRSARHHAKCVEYIRENPVRAKLGKESFVLFQKEGGHSCPPLEKR